MSAYINPMIFPHHNKHHTKAFNPFLKKGSIFIGGSHAVNADPDIFTDISYIRLALGLVVGGGFEPPKASPTDLQSVPFGHSGTPPEFYMEPETGVEPATSSLQVRRSTS